jgi:hypothetical protein
MGHTRRGERRRPRLNIFQRLSMHTGVPSLRSGRDMYSPHHAVLGISASQRHYRYRDPHFAITSLDSDAVATETKNHPHCDLRPRDICCSYRCCPHLLSPTIFRSLRPQNLTVAWQ